MGHTNGGPRRQPNALKKLKGNPHQHTLVPEPKVEYPEGIPAPPEDLPENAGSEWVRVAKILHGAKLLAKIDLSAFEMYCRIYDRWIQAERMVVKVGLIIKTPNGYPIQNPLLTVINASLTQMRNFLCEFGMTPSARSRIHIPEEKEKGQEEEIENFLKAGKKLKAVRGGKGE